ncbi:MAG TPA: helix-turn-helix domain-containing protein [Usitatibacter sp.]|nr:helix-turn-helix domain-containing protein [Usitatibacter sp.]
MTDGTLPRYAPQPRVSRPSLNGTGGAEAASDTQVRQSRLVRRGHALYRAGDAFEAIYMVLSGCLKDATALEDGRSQVTGFHMSGELVGLDGMADGLQASDVIALEDSHVASIDFAQLDEPVMRRHLQAAMGRELVRKHRMMLLLGSMRAGERLAAFLLDLSERLRARGLPALELDLCMSRGEIASYLGVRIETVSRLFTRFHREGLIRVREKHVEILRLPGPQENASPHRPAPRAQPGRPPGVRSRRPAPHHPR